jgi:hypothetical protein
MMIYLKISICRPERSSTFNDACGTAEFMIQGLEEETATRLALTLLRNDGWRAFNVIEAVHAASPDVFVRNGRLRAMYEEARVDDVACAISCDTGVLRAVA